MLILAHSDFGRILLHLGALLGDGAFRFHAAGVRASCARRGRGARSHAPPVFEVVRSSF